jgi:hypothetical protein
MRLRPGNKYIGKAKPSSRCGESRWDYEAMPLRNDCREVVDKVVFRRLFKNIQMQGARNPEK